MNKLWVSLIVVIFMIAGCSRIGPERMPGMDLAIAEMNVDLHLSARPELNTFTIGDWLTVDFDNRSDTPMIILPNDGGVREYQYVDGQWQPIENPGNYHPGEYIVFPREQRTKGIRSIDIFPSISSDLPVNLRVVIVGNYYDITTEALGGQVGAFIDLELKPEGWPEDSDSQTGRPSVYSASARVSAAAGLLPRMRACSAGQ